MKQNNIIKFRAWNPDLQQMEYCTKDQYWAIYNDESSIQWGLYDRKDGHRILSGEHAPPLMRFTGIIDIHGKEMYVGDKIKCMSRGMLFHAIVVSSDFGFDYEPLDDFSKQYEHMLYPPGSELEIFGHIYDGQESDSEYSSSSS